MEKILNFHKNFNLNKIPQAFSQSSSELTSKQEQVDFDQDVKEYCRQSRTDFLTLKMCKTIVVGNMGVGKTCLVRRFVNNSFQNDYKATIGVDFEVQQFRILNTNFNMQIWDTAGAERFKCIATAYYRGSEGIIAVFDLCEPKSLYDAERWLTDALNTLNSDQSTPFLFLVGTKKDLLDLKADKKKIDSIHSEAMALAHRLNAEYWPVSSLTSENVQKLFSRCACLLFNSKIRREIEINENKNKRTITESHLIDLSNEKSNRIRIKSNPQLFLNLVDDKNCC